MTPSTAVPPAATTTSMPPDPTLTPTTVSESTTIPSPTVVTALPTTTAVEGAVDESDVDTTDSPTTSQVEATSTSAPAELAVAVAVEATASGSISGTVTDEDGNPLRGVSVSVQRDYRLPVVGSAETSVDGSYQIALSAGVYFVLFRGDGQHLGEWYDNAEDFFSATGVAVATGAMVTGIDAQLTEHGTISGIVTDANGDPVEGVQVSAGGFLASTRSDGSYLITVLFPGSYTVAFRDVDDRGFAPEWYDDANNEGSATPVEVDAGEAVVGIDAQLAQGGSISGRVTDESGNPLAGITAMVGGWHDQRAVTGTDGSYQIRGLAADSHTVQFQDSETGGYLGEWFQDAPDEASATPVVVGGGQAVSGIDAQLAVGGSIGGMVTDESGDPLAGIAVTVGELDNRSTSSEADGSYQIRGLAAGSYTVQFQDLSNGDYLGEWFDDALDQASATPVVVGGGQAVPGIDAQLAVGGSISGTVTDANGDPVVAVSVTVEGMVVDGSWSGGSAETLADGSYQIRGLAAGSYEVRFGDPADRYLTEWYDNAYFYESRTLVVVGDGKAVVGIDAQLSEGGSISGTVIDVNGDPVEGIEVSTSDGSSLTASDGSYLITGLIPGSFTVFFRDVDDVANRGYLPEWYDDAVNESSATPVVVADGEAVVGIDAQLSTGSSISGTVTDEDGIPLAGIKVSVRGPVRRSVTTGPSGLYRLAGLTAGRYVVQFEDLDDGYVAEYFDDADRKWKATRIVLDEGAVVSGVDAQLAQVSSIGGTVLDKRGRAVAGVSVTLYSASGRRYGSEMSARDGSFVFEATDVPGGNYTLYLRDPAHRYRSGWYGGAWVPRYAPRFTIGLAELFSFDPPEQIDVEFVVERRPHHWKFHGHRWPVSTWSGVS